MKSKLIGGILLIVGTTIGGGMLALPMVTAQGGFWGASLLLILSWMVMTFCAFLILEVNLWMPINSNLILMAKRTLGGWAQIVAWVCYLLLFYCLLAAYISGGSDILHGLLSKTHFNTSSEIDAILFTLILGLIVYKGIQTIDYTNRALMLIKLVAFVLLIIFIAPHIEVERFNAGHVKYLVPAFTVVMTSFGFSTLIPSLRSYFNNDVQKLRKVILIGSLIPLACYIAWVGAIFGGIPFDGEFGLMSMIKSDHSTLALTQALIHHSNNGSITTFTNIFTSVCVLTSFLGVALCVVDFLADGFNLEKVGLNNLFLHVATFVPPLIIALLYPTAFIVGLSYAGVCLAILIIVFPVLMVWNGRYRKKIVSTYRVVGGKLPLILAGIVGALVVFQGLFWVA
jgi:tyrosine-specific transport protein